MANKKTDLYVWMILIVIFIGWPVNLQSAFYKYVDKQGRIFYVDDLYKIPEEYRDQVQVYREKYDHLSDQERSEALERDRQLQLKQEQEHARQLSEHLKETQRLEEAEKRKKEAEARRKLQEKLQTKVMVDGNRILVPVTLDNDGVEVDTHLLLDTGASQIVLHRALATQLNIITLKKGLAQVAGGQIIQVETGQISSFKVGPHNMKNVMVLIMPHEGPSPNFSGMLGMNFLKNVPYTIDYQNQVIRWQLPQEPVPGD